MDPALLKERELFKKHALATPVVESKKKRPDAPKKSERNDFESSKKRPKTSSSSAVDIVSYKTMTGSSQYKFGVLVKVVKHMKSRHQDGDTHPLTFDELLDETNQLDVGTRVRQWLITEALPKNPKIETTPEGTYVFKPPYKIKDKKALLKLLKQNDLKGLGGILLEDVLESLPKAEKALRLLKDDIIQVARPIDKKVVLFYNDRTCQFQVDEEFGKIWRSTAVDALDDDKVMEYLEKQGIRSMHDTGVKKMMPLKNKKSNRKKSHLKKPRDNEHMSHILESYDESKG